MGPIDGTANFHGKNCALQVGQNYGNIQYYADDGHAVAAALPVAQSAAFNSYEEEHESRCLPETREEILRSITDWVDNPAAKPMFWLCGMAGTGKSTISRTIAETFSKRGLLGASFFFSRDQRDRSRASLFFTTVASQLVASEPGLAPYMAAAIQKDPAIPGKALAEQFERLIHVPLSSFASENAISNGFLIIVDALDECERDHDIKTLVQLLSKASRNTLTSLKVFVTSRPETAVRLGFSFIRSDYQDLILHEIPTTIMAHDLNIFFEHRLAEIREKFNALADVETHLPLEWPQSGVIQKLTQISTPLFIFAATVCRFIEDPVWSDPPAQLQIVLEQQTKVSDSEIGRLNRTYGYILNRIVANQPSAAKSKLLSEFGYILGSIVTLLEPLTKSSLATLLDVPPRVLHGRLAALHSVLRVSSSAELPVSPLHLSFRDFLLDSSTTDLHPFRIEECQVHDELTRRCLDLLSKDNNLRQDICNLGKSGILRSEVAPEVIRAVLVPPMRYACLFWIDHLEKSPRNASTMQLAKDFLYTHFLHWLEALSLLGEVAKLGPMLGRLKSVVSDCEDRELSSFIHDAWRFVLYHRSVIELAPLQIYSSALAFTPLMSLIRIRFRNYLPPWLAAMQNTQYDWTACLQIFQGCSCYKVSLSFSKYDSTLVSGCYQGDIHVWDLVTGTLLQTLVSDRDCTFREVSSSDAGLIIKTSNKGVDFWNLTTGSQQSITDRSLGGVGMRVFSPIENILAVASDDGTLRVWDINLLSHMHKIRFIADFPNETPFDLTLSPDGKTLAYCTQLSRLLTLEIRCIETRHGRLIRSRKCEENEYTGFAISPDASLLAIGCMTYVELWNADDVESKQFFLNEGSDLVAITISPSGSYLAAGDTSGILYIWHIFSTQLKWKFQDLPEVIPTILFAPDSRTLVSSSTNGTLKLWNIDVQDGYVPTSRNPTNLTSRGTTNLVSYPQIHKPMIIALGQHTLRSLSMDPLDLENLRDFSHPSFPQYNHEILAVSSDGNKVIVASADNSLHFRVLSNPQFDVLKGIGFPVHCVAFSPHDTAFVLATKKVRAYDISICDTQRLTIRHNFSTNLPLVSAVAMSGDETLVVLATTDDPCPAIRIYESSTGILQRKVLCESDSIFDLPFCTIVNPELDMMAYSLRSGVVTLKRFTSGNTFASLDTRKKITSMRFSPDGQFLITNRGEYHIAERGTAHSIEEKMHNREHGLVIRESWIAYNGERVLWLPTDYHTSKAVVQGNVVALFGESDLPVIILFKNLSRYFGRDKQ